MLSMFREMQLKQQREHEYIKAKIPKNSTDKDFVRVMMQPLNTMT